MLVLFLNTDKTHHSFPNESGCGGSRAVQYACSFMSCSGYPVIKNGRHTTRWYTTNAYGEALPPFYTLENKAKYKENYKIDPRGCVLVYLKSLTSPGLPITIGASSVAHIIIVLLKTWRFCRVYLSVRRAASMIAYKCNLLKT